MNWYSIFVGLATLIPGVYKHFSRTGGTNSASYCYSVWMRHLVRARKAGLISSPPLTVAELGPGDTIGVGLAALLSGAEYYIALDTVRYAVSAANLKVFDELVIFFRNRVDIPDISRLRGSPPLLDDYRFPYDLLDENILSYSLNDKRIAAIRAELSGQSEAQQYVRYVVPWDKYALIPHNSVEFVYSQAVMEHVDDLESAYLICNHLLINGGVMSHAIDYRSHKLTKEWNGHWACSDWEWQLIRGGRPFLLNRKPHSEQVRYILLHNFELCVNESMYMEGGVQRNQLAEPFRDMTDEDLQTSAAFIQALKPKRV